MDGNSGFLTLLMNFFAPLALGLALLYVLLRTRRTDWRQRAHTEKATEDLYERVDETRERRDNEEQK